MPKPLLALVTNPKCVQALCKKHLALMTVRATGGWSGGALTTAGSWSIAVSTAPVI